MAIEQPCETWFAELIRSAALAGSCSVWVRREPAAAAGLTRIANRERKAATLLLKERILSAHGPYGGRTVGARAASTSGGREALDGAKE